MALGRLNQLRFIVLACPLVIPFCRNRVDPESDLRFDGDCLPLLECLGVDGVVTQLVEDLLTCLTTISLPSLQRFDIQGTNVD
ncbi:hypothetical protein BKA70DRAFT_259987 [Coprinopsis sp. MPI-PUGE-AT-0042]|nr:hypothetical protein BKA70DRAFT_259987 [Coprinopsis sp. MPI-PUGE-AT-0042]